MNDIFVDTWGTGTPVVLVHGSLATGADEWQAQRVLADEGFRLLVIDRRGYGKSPVAQDEDGPEAKSRCLDATDKPFNRRKL